MSEVSVQHLMQNEMRRASGVRAGCRRAVKIAGANDGTLVMKPCIGFAQASAGDVNHSTQLRQMVNGLAWVATKGAASRERLWGDACNLRSRDTRMEYNPPKLRKRFGAPKGAQTLGKETSEYQQEEKSIEIPLLAASENGIAQTESVPERVWRCSVRPSICDPSNGSRSCLKWHRIEGYTPVGQPQERSC
jgi:hypothetical protein